MANFDNFVRCQEAIQAVCSASIPCIRNILETWHQQMQATIPACTTPQICPNKGKPKANKGSCKACVDWANALELAKFSPTPGTLAWSNVNPTQLHNDPVEAAKAFVLRLQADIAYSDVGDFDAASLLMIMMNFKKFNQSSHTMYDAIKKV